MKKFLKILLCGVLAVAFSLTLVACAPQDDNSGKKTGLLYKKVNDTYVVYDYVDDGSGVTGLNISNALRADVDNVTIKAGAFENNNTLKSIELGDKVSKIEAGAFRKMTALETLELTFVGYTAKSDAYFKESKDDVDKAVDSQRCIAHLFSSEEYAGGVPTTVNYGSGSVRVYIPETLKKIVVNPSASYSIPMYAFNGFILENIELKGAIDAIGEYAFGDCKKIASISIPDSVQTIYANAFNGAIKLKTITFGTNSLLVKVGDYAFKNTKLISSTLPNGVQLGNGVFDKD